MKIQIVAAALSLVASLGLLAGGCKYALAHPAWPLNCTHEDADAPCAACVKTSCCTEATTCGNDARCECLTGCQKDEAFFESGYADNFFLCEKGCQSSSRTSPTFVALSECVKAHCSNLCTAAGKDGGAASPKPGVTTP
jgi:hypothetical protein